MAVVGICSLPVLTLQVRRTACRPFILEMHVKLTARDFFSGKLEKWFTTMVGYDWHGACHRLPQLSIARRILWRPTTLCSRILDRHRWSSMMCGYLWSVREYLSHSDLVHIQAMAAVLQTPLECKTFILEPC